MLSDVILVFIATGVFALLSLGKRGIYRIGASIAAITALIASVSGLAAAYQAEQAITEIQHHVQGASASVGAGFWMMCLGLLLVGAMMLMQLVLSLRAFLQSSGENC